MSQSTLAADTIGGDRSRFFSQALGRFRWFSRARDSGNAAARVVQVPEGVSSKSDDADYLFRSVDATAPRNIVPRIRW